MILTPYGRALFVHVNAPSYINKKYTLTIGFPKDDPLLEFRAALKKYLTSIEITPSSLVSKWQLRHSKRAYEALMAEDLNTFVDTREHSFSWPIRRTPQVSDLNLVSFSSYVAPVIHRATAKEIEIDSVVRVGCTPRYRIFPKTFRVNFALTLDLHAIQLSTNDNDSVF